MESCTEATGGPGSTYTRMRRGYRNAAILACRRERIDGYPCPSPPGWKPGPPVPPAGKDACVPGRKRRNRRWLVRLQLAARALLAGAEGDRRRVATVDVGFAFRLFVPEAAGSERGEEEEGEEAHNIS